jgi:3-hydroxyacyl-CoA dehydrogenase/enoyl-CoA hydratase/3-hydroxybutyryl-CoA epimerase
MRPGSAARISMTPSASIVERAARVGIVGPGLMGLGIAEACAAAGFAVALSGRHLAAAKAGRDRLSTALRRRVERGRMDAARAAAIVAKIEPADLTAEGLAGCGIVIESVREDRALKLAILGKMELAAPDAILATNTSGLAIAGLAAALRDPARFVGLHFFSPAERMPLVEVVRGELTAPATVDAALSFLAALGKHPVLVRDGPGFYATRVFAAFLDEGVAMFADGVAPEAIEAAATGYGRALGPLAMLDETGVALNLAQARQARADGLEPRFCRSLAESALARLVAVGRAGRRAGGGFFDWPAEGSRTPWPGLVKAYPLASPQPDPSSNQLRLLAAEAREALRCLEEGVVASADDADVASVLGLGFPKALGGILRWAEDFGLARLTPVFDEFAAVHGERFTCSPWLRALATHGEGLIAYRTKETAA